MKMSSGCTRRLFQGIRTILSRNFDEFPSRSPQEDYPSFNKSILTREYWGLPPPKPIASTRKGTQPGDEDRVGSCIICMSNFRDTILVPCGHFVICGDCAVELLRSAENRYTAVSCPICKKYVHHVYHVFM
ncbi:Zinc finger - RING-type [Perkinsela sp. CCAP 1560/4]|nr:Zinc finger - RING-type [Perkinsela sp. CCAP 1560/4]|eukprot:KNH08889.1 Zinc finger - RING-type [Perkinsela sp. CCAP 1560/4]